MNPRLPLTLLLLLLSDLIWAGCFPMANQPDSVFLFSYSTEKNEKVVKRIAASVVRDSKSNDIIVKMVNLLPVEARTKIDFSKMARINTTAERIVLTGSPDEKTAQPKTDQINVNSNTSTTLPPYSFTLLRIKIQ